MTESERWIADKCGIVSRIVQLEEEWTELFQVICKAKRFNRGDVTLSNTITSEWLQDHFVEELADVQLVLDQIIYLTGLERYVGAAREEKVKRTIERIQKAEKSEKEAAGVSMIRNQTEALRSVAGAYNSGMAKLLNDAADTIEELSAKLAAANMANSTSHYNNGWIPVEERLPENETLTMVSFDNLGIPAFAFYKEDDDGGAFYPGNDRASYAEYNLFVNAWQPVPKTYKPD